MSACRHECPKGEAISCFPQTKNPVLRRTLRCDQLHRLNNSEKKIVWFIARAVESVDTTGRQPCNVVLLLERLLQLFVVVVFCTEGGHQRAEGKRTIAAVPSLPLTHVP